MNNNYGWQQHQVNERIQGALSEAKSHRMARQGPTGRSKLTTSFIFAMLLGLGLFLGSLLISGCSPRAIAQASSAESQVVIEPAAPQASLESTMADRIRFQDRLWEQKIANGVPVATQGQTPSWWTMADRIRFQDRRDSHR